MAWSKMVRINGYKVADLRHSKGLKQADFGVPSPNRLSEIEGSEQFRVRRATADKIAEKLGIGLSDILVSERKTGRQRTQKQSEAGKEHRFELVEVDLPQMIRDTEQTWVIAAQAMADGLSYTVSVAELLANARLVEQLREIIQELVLQNSQSKESLDRMMLIIDHTENSSPER
jgi:transcriptional regulator with XRE-family HTH domain